MLINLKLLRMKKGKTQGEFAKMIGMSLTWYSLLENGRYRATDEIKSKLEKALDMNAEYLLAESDVLNDMGGVKYD